MDSNTSQGRLVPNSERISAKTPKSKRKAESRPMPKFIYYPVAFNKSYAMNFWTLCFFDQKLEQEYNLYRNTSHRISHFWLNMVLIVGAVQFLLFAGSVLSTTEILARGIATIVAILVQIGFSKRFFFGRPFLYRFSSIMILTSSTLYAVVTFIIQPIFDWKAGTWLTDNSAVMWRTIVPTQLFLLFTMNSFVMVPLKVKVIIGALLVFIRFTLQYSMTLAPLLHMIASDNYSDEEKQALNDMYNQNFSIWLQTGWTYLANWASSSLVSYQREYISRSNFASLRANHLLAKLAGMEEDTTRRIESAKKDSNMGSTTDKDKENWTALSKDDAGLKPEYIRAIKTDVGDIMRARDLRQAPKSSVDLVAYNETAMDDKMAHIPRDTTKSLQNIQAQRQKESISFLQRLLSRLQKSYKRLVLVDSGSAVFEQKFREYMHPRIIKNAILVFSLMIVTNGIQLLTSYWQAPLYGMIFHQATIHAIVGISISVIGLVTYGIIYNNFKKSNSKCRAETSGIHWVQGGLVILCCCYFMIFILVSLPFVPISVNPLLQFQKIRIATNMFSDTVITTLLFICSLGLQMRYTLFYSIFTILATFFLVFALSDMAGFLISTIVFNNCIFLASCGIFSYCMERERRFEFISQNLRR